MASHTSDGKHTLLDNKMKRTKIILIVAIVLGLGYGYMSGIRNQNPYYSPDGKELQCDSEHHPAWAWQPSPAWLPSFQDIGTYQLNRALFSRQKLTTCAYDKCLGCGRGDGWMASKGHLAYIGQRLMKIGA